MCEEMFERVATWWQFATRASLSEGQRTALTLPERLKDTLALNMGLVYSFFSTVCSDSGEYI